MKNKEKYADEIITTFINNETCEFKQQHILGIKECCKRIECETRCSKLTKQWLETEYQPPKTRQSEFLKMFPNASVSDDNTFLYICPNDLDTSYICPHKKGDNVLCSKCRQMYWGKKIE